MGEIADMMIDGVLCQYCGVIMDDLIPDDSDELLEAPGYPRSCEDCSE